MILGVPENPFATNSSRALLEAAARLGVRTRAIDLSTLRLELSSDGQSLTADRDGVVEVEALTPFLLFGFGGAAHALRRMSRAAYSQNPVDSVETADDKARTAEILSHERLPQVTTHICSLDLPAVSAAARKIGFPVVVKRTHGAQGRWVRRARDQNELSTAFVELQEEGPGALVVQPEITSAEGRTTRVLITDGKFVAATERVPNPADWRSNVACGAEQSAVSISASEELLSEAAAKAVGLRHAGLDLIHTDVGTAVLEINACPDFTSMLPYFDFDLAEEVVRACLGK